MISLGNSNKSPRSDHSNVPHFSMESEGTFPNYFYKESITLTVVMGRMCTFTINSYLDPPPNMMVLRCGALGRQLGLEVVMRVSPH